MPPCGGAPYSSASSRNPKRLLRFLFAEAQRRENLRLHVAAVNTNRARAQLHAVQHQVVGFRAAARRIGRQLFEILVVHRGEGMVRGVPAALLLVPFEHREIDHPQELEVLGSSSLCRSLYFCAACSRSWPQASSTRFFRTLPFRLARPSGQQQQIVLGRARALAHLGHLLGKIAIQPLHVVDRRAARAPGRKPSNRRVLCGDTAPVFGITNGDQRQALRRSDSAPRNRSSTQWNGGMRRSGLSLP